jgi:hypothetical protein
MILIDHARTMVDQDTFVVASADRIPVATSFVHDDHCCSEHNKSRTAAKPFLRMHDWGATLLAAFIMHFAVTQFMVEVSCSERSNIEIEP